MAFQCSQCGGSGKQGNYTCTGCGGSGTAQGQMDKHNDSCFPATTNIRTPTGFVPVKDLQKFDLVISYDSKRAELREQRILHISEYPKRPLWKLQLSDGTQLLTTSSHSFLSGRNLLMARELHDGDCVSVLNKKGHVSEVRILYSSPANECQDVYKIVVAEDFTLIAEGVVAHSFTHFRLAQTIFWRVIGAVDRITKKISFLLRTMINTPSITQCRGN